MKLKIGHKLQSIREDRKMSQAEFAELLSVSQSQYARLERGETQLPFEQLAQFSTVLNVPIQEFLPDTLAFNNNNQQGGGNIFGTYNYYANPEDGAKELQHQLEKQQLTIQRLEEKNALLESEVAFLRALVAQKNDNKK